MTLINPIQYLAKQGLTITLLDNKLNVKPSNLVTREIAHYIKQHKDTIKNELLTASYPPVKHTQLLAELNSKQYNWLSQIADILNVTPDYLLQHQLLDEYDLIELVDKEPAIVANAIKAGYHWQTDVQ